MSRQQTLSVIVEGFVQRSGTLAAQRWLEQQLNISPKHPPYTDDPPAHDALSLSNHFVSTRLESEPTQVHNEHLRFKLRPLPDTLSGSETALDDKLLDELVTERVEGIETLTACLDGLRAQLSPTAFRLFVCLWATAEQVIQTRSYSPHVSHVTFFCPQDIVVKVLGVVRSTVWRAIQELIRQRLLDAREWKTDFKGSTRNGGYLWKVKMDPLAPTQPKLQLDEFKFPWRDLEKDVAQGRTAYNIMNDHRLVNDHRSVKEHGMKDKGEGKDKNNRVKDTLHQSLDQEGSQQDINLILDWALPPKPMNKPPLSLESLTDAAPESQRVYSLETILDLSGAPKTERNEMVDLTARAIGKCLNDTGVTSLMFYRKLLWNLLRQYDQGNDWFFELYTLASRARVDCDERFARKPGALLVSRLKHWHRWGEIEQTLPSRVASGGLRA
ncbi:MAG: hypothetical protein ACRCYY_04990 [Trueperaceae bacterium]